MMSGAVRCRTFHCHAVQPLAKDWILYQSSLPVHAQARSLFATIAQWKSDCIILLHSVTGIGARTRIMHPLLTFAPYSLLSKQSVQA